MKNAMTAEIAAEVSQPAPHTAHPGANLLLLAAWARLPDRLLIPVLEHVAGCERCARHLTRYEEVEDHWWARTLSN